MDICLESLDLKDRLDYKEFRGLLYGLCICDSITREELFDFFLPALSDAHYGEVCNDVE